MAQASFTAAVMNPEMAIPSGLVDPKGRPAPKRFAVYRNNVAVSLTKALEDGFPVIRRLVGEEFFAAMAGVFLRAHPPKSPVLMGYGSNFPTFLEDFAPVAHLGYLPDMARLELALRDSYHAGDATPIDPQSLGRLPVEALLACRLTLAPSLRLVRSDWPIHAIWRANTSGGTKPVMRAEDVVILRREYDPTPSLLAPGAAGFLAALMAGLPLGAAIEANPDCDLNMVLGLLLPAQAIVEILP